MADFPAVPLLGEATRSFISPMSLNSLGPGFATGPGDVAWPSANLAIFVPFRISSPFTVQTITLGGGATATGNYDGGVYDANGNRLVSTGTQAKPASSETVVDVTDTTLYAGLYYMAVSSSTTNNITGWSISAAVSKLVGIRHAATSFVLPTTVTYATASTAVIPSICLNGAG